LEGDFDEKDKFVHIPLGNLQRMSEYFHSVIIKFFLKKQLISAKLSTSLINWRHSGFSNGDGNLIFYTSNNDFFNAKTKTFTAMRFLLELTQHIPPRRAQYIRRYGLYASRTKCKWPNKPYVVRLAPPGWKKEHL